MKLKIIIVFCIYIFASFVCGCVRGAWGGGARTAMAHRRRRRGAWGRPRGQHRRRRGACTLREAGPEMGPGSAGKTCKTDRLPAKASQLRSPGKHKYFSSGPGPAPAAIFGSGDRARAHTFQNHVDEDMFFQTYFENIRYHVFKMGPNQGFQNFMIW